MQKRTQNRIIQKERHFNSRPSILNDKKVSQSDIESTLLAHTLSSLPSATNIKQYPTATIKHKQL